LALIVGDSLKYRIVITDLNGGVLEDISSTSTTSPKNIKDFGFLKDGDKVGIWIVNSSNQYATFGKDASYFAHDMKKVLDLKSSYGNLIYTSSSSKGDLSACYQAGQNSLKVVVFFAKNRNIQNNFEFVPAKASRFGFCQFFSMNWQKDMLYYCASERAYESFYAGEPAKLAQTNGKMPSLFSYYNQDDNIEYETTYGTRYAIFGKYKNTDFDKEGYYLGINRMYDSDIEDWRLFDKFPQDSKLYHPF